MDKRLIYLLAVSFAAVLFGISPASAQTPEFSMDPTTPAVSADSVPQPGLVGEPIPADSLERIDSVDTDLVALRRSNDGEEVVLEVAGFGITLSSLSDEKIRDRNARIKRPRWSLVLFYKTEWGYNIPSKVDYGVYPAGTDAFFDLRGGKSFHLSTTLAGLNYVFGKQRQFDLTTGLRYTVDNYRLSDNSITLGNENGRIVPLTLDEKADKSKLRITSLGIPLHLAYHPMKQMTLSLSGYFDFTMGANSIYKHPKEKSALSGVRTFRFGVGVGVTYYRCGIYFRYGVTPLFESGVGPKVHPLSLGICFGL